VFQDNYYVVTADTTKYVT